MITASPKHCRRTSEELEELAIGQYVREHNRNNQRSTRAGGNGVLPTSPAASSSSGFDRIAHLRPARLVGGDAAARYPVVAAGGFLDQLMGLPDVTAAPFAFPDRYGKAAELLRKDVRTFATSSAGRLFDTAAVVLGFMREVSFEGQAAMWLEHNFKIHLQMGPCGQQKSGIALMP